MLLQSPAISTVSRDCNVIAYCAGERIPIDDVNEAVGQVFTAIRGIVKANLSVDRANEVFDEMRRVADWIQQKSDGA
jgi:hypothetical protein